MSTTSASTQQVNLCRRLREEIILGRLGHGQRITEKFISERMQVKRGPARESLLILEGQGLVRKVPSLGYFVETHTADEIREVYEVRLTLETLAVTKAATRATRESVVQLELICEDEGAALARDDLAARVACDLDFHQAIVRAAGSRVIQRAYEAIARPIYGSPDLKDTEGRRVSAQHVAICKAIRMRDPALAARLLREHIVAYSGFQGSGGDEGDC